METAVTSAPANDISVDIRGGWKSFGEKPVLKDISLTIRRGELVALLGKSGSGKTTILRILLGLDQFDDGEAWVAEPRSVVFQEPRLVPSQRVWRNTLLGVARTRTAYSRALDALREVGLQSHAEAWPGTLSGGEAQRVALARALIREPRLLLLDEPFAALDALTRLKMQDLVRDLFVRHRPGVFLVTHDVDEALRLADRVVVLKDGRFSIDIKLPSNRNPLSADIAGIRQSLFAELGVNAFRSTNLSDLADREKP
ncbi:sulfonate ABC transporter ATP-binding protein [Ochrobactrum sp. MYb68]|nr:sulfonate ABC transporter ATP-binding protein [Ochrobactrum sp. MYb68]